MVRSARMALPLLALVTCLGLWAGCTTRPPSPLPDARSPRDRDARGASVQPKLMQYQTIGGIVVGVPRSLARVSDERAQP